MKTNFLFILSFLILMSSCKSSEKNKIDEKMMLKAVKFLASDSLEGRGFSKPGNYEAAKFIDNKFNELGLEPFLGGSFTQQFKYQFSGKKRQRMFPLKDSIANLSNTGDTLVIGGNVIGKISGKIKKTIVITGHLDHLGIKNGKIYNGADDDASGTAALFAIAKYFKQHSPKHTLVFAAVDAEEIGSLGADYFLKNYPNKENIVLNINMDMIANNNKQQLYASGLFHYPQLKQPLENITSPITLLFGHDNPDDKNLDDWTFSSDHRIFHKEKIPFIYFGVEDHKDYHKPTDTFENMNQEFYVDAVKLIVQAIENYDSYLN
ncbi:peptidase M20 [Polaribacter sp. ALD11]|uniref:M20/M25/M40 family metallo-hydrolase n=1 Tax=Polaribacter sp. ALD11 TaxID=2058137 RepID=UPI000C3135D8|nr:M20/M25/M40 family metallo-hydrolase [Polaribacter sp. ALD11]AUC85175.1 peptidase M20 [Polaribacter sp. ALD11]